MSKHVKQWSLTIFLIFTIINVLFYSFYLYLKYAKNREAVRPYYDDEKKQLRSSYDHIWYIWCALFVIWAISGSMFSQKKFGNKAGELFIYIFLIVITIVVLTENLIKMVL